MAKGTFEFPENQYSFNVEFKEVIVVGDESSTYILEDENGNQLVGVLVDEKTVFDATANDIRLGKVAATEDGITTGEKVIPSYNTSEGVALIPVGSEFKIRTPDYDYTKLQSISCEFNNTLLNSVSAIQVVIENNVYKVNSTESIGVVTKDDTTSTIKFNVDNTSGKLCLVRYFMYKEIY